MTRQILEYHPVIGYRFIPNLKARIPHEGGGYLIQTNSSGFRCCHEFKTDPTPFMKRVLLFGDSYTAGDGVSNGQRYGDKIEALANAEVYNFGLPGTAPDQHYLAFMEHASKIRADLTMITVLVENIRRIAARYRPYQNEQGNTVLFSKPYFTLINGSLELHGVPVGREPIKEADLPEQSREFVDTGGRFASLRKIMNRVGLKDLTQRALHYQPLPEYDDPQNSYWLLMRAILEKFIAAVPKPVVVMPLPLYQHVEGTADPSGYQSRFSELADSNPCLVHDPLPSLLKYSPTERRSFRFAQDIHPTPAGHVAIAASLAPVVMDLLGMKKVT